MNNKDTQPSATVDTPDFQRALETWWHAMDNTAITLARNALVAHIDAHVAAVAEKAVEEALENGIERGYNRALANIAPSDMDLDKLSMHKRHAREPKVSMMDEEWFFACSDVRELAKKTKVSAPQQHAQATSIIREADAVFDLMLDGCIGDYADFSKWQNGNGEEIGGRIEALRAALKAANSGVPPVQAALSDALTKCVQAISGVPMSFNSELGQAYHNARAILAVSQQPAAAPVDSGVNAAIAAIEFAITGDDGLTWLRLWNEGEFDKCRKEWPEAPAECYIGADPLLATAAAPADSNARRDRLHAKGAAIGDAPVGIGPAVQVQDERARDNCELCHGEKGGVLGNENIVGATGGIKVCDYCHADGSATKALEDRAALTKGQK